MKRKEEVQSALFRSEARGQLTAQGESEAYLHRLRLSPWVGIGCGAAFLLGAVVWLLS